MFKKILYSRIFNNMLKTTFKMFYKEQYLRGKYFEKKRMGWYWAFRGLPSRLIGSHRRIPWPVHPRTIISNSKNITFDINDLHIFQTPGCYWQNHKANIVIGEGSHVGPNVGLITTNHDLYNLDNHGMGKDIILGKSCWIGMNAVILPGVELGDHTIVGAGSVVTKSFPKGFCVIAGNPAKIIKELDKHYLFEGTNNI